ncbi:MAG: ATP-binding cassette domain-containing protein [Gammaproteobacteria bacterium]
MLTVTDLQLQREGRSLHPALSFALDKGQSLWVKGPNGTGKSSLLKALLGWLPHEGVSITPDTRLAYLGHHTGLASYLTVWQHCALHPAIKHFDPLTCTQLLGVLGLGKLAHAQIGILSAGQKQRLALVPIMLSGASLWLLDEPFTALDTASVAQVKALLSGFLAQGVAMMIVSHDDLGDWATQTLSMGDA